MKLLRLIGLGAAFFSATAAGAYPPLWLTKLPPKTETYYYRMAQGTGATEEEAITKAFINAVCESAYAVDLPVNLEALLKMPADSTLAIYGKNSRIPVNKVCSYTEAIGTRPGYRAYVLCQVASKAGVKPKYNTFNCLLNREEK
jgi:hypothetical protein